MSHRIVYSTQTTVVSVGASSTSLVASNPLRKYLAIHNTGSAPVTVRFGAGAAVANQGRPIAAGASAQWESGVVPLDAITAILSTGSTATTIVVEEGI